MSRRLVTWRFFVDWGRAKARAELDEMLLPIVRRQLREAEKQSKRRACMIARPDPHDFLWAGDESTTA
jgi:hypothetical protein